MTDLRLRVPVPMHRELRRAAAELGVSMADLIRLIVRTWLRQRREQAAA